MCLNLDFRTNMIRKQSYKRNLVLSFSHPSNFHIIYKRVLCSFFLLRFGFLFFGAKILAQMLVVKCW